MLVIGSCTGKKDDETCPPAAKLTPEDFNDPVRLKKREAELSPFLRTGSAMYMGRQHTQMMEGVQIIRSQYGNDACVVSIVSAGYGLIGEKRQIAPYNVTFHGAPKRFIRARGEKLRIPTELRSLVSGFPIVVFLLGDDYLTSAKPPIIPSQSQRFIAFGSPKLRSVPGSNVIVIPSSDDAAEAFGDNVRTRKGRMFKILASGLGKKPQAWRRLLADDTPSTVLELMHIGKASL